MSARAILPVHPRDLARTRWHDWLVDVARRIKRELDRMDAAFKEAGRGGGGQGPPPRASDPA